MFASVIRCVERIAAWCKLSGWALEIPCIIHDQGENDYTANPTTYYNDLVANQAAYEVAIDAVFAKFGLTNNGPSGSAYSHIPFLCIQPSSWGFTAMRRRQRCMSIRSLSSITPRSLS